MHRKTICPNFYDNKKIQHNNSKDIEDFILPLQVIIQGPIPFLLALLSHKPVNQLKFQIKWQHNWQIKPSRSLRSHLSKNALSTPPATCIISII